MAGFQPLNVNPLAEFKIRILEKHFDRASFSCGNEALDRYLRQQARQDIEKKVAVTFCLVDRDRQIAGYYALSSCGVRLSDLPENVIRKLPKYPMVPATLLARLAVSRNHQGKGIGELLLVDALNRSLSHSHEIGSLAVVVDAKDDTAKSFYRRYGFIQFHAFPNRLFISLRTIEKMHSRSGLAGRYSRP